MKRPRGEALERLHHGLTRERELVGSSYLDEPELLGAYERHFGPMSYAKARAVLREVCNLAPRRIIDVGAGPGSMAQAAHDLFPEAEVIACDRSAKALEHVPSGVRAKRWDLDGAIPSDLGPADVILFGNVLNELSADPVPIVERIAERLLAAEGLIVIIEPALRQTARSLEEARGRWIENGWHIVAPCLYRDRCPALVRERDWCHENRGTRGEEDETLKFAYLVMNRGGEWPTDERLFRVVSARRTTKGKEELFGCGPKGRFRLTRLDRHASEGNGAWDAIVRGDVISVEGETVRGEELRVGAETKVRVVQPVVR